ncbi:MAG: 23S rRNA (guanosine(2251)-2'-O)-methyltransferase RlmB [Bacteroidia bacterium]
MKSEKDEIIYGIHAVEEAVAAGREISKVLIQQEYRGEGLTGLVKLLRKEAIPYQHLPKERMKRMPGRAQQGVVAFISPIEFHDLQQLLPALFEQGKMPLIAVLDGITDVRNIGAIARSAECFGVHALVVAAKGTGAINADAVKSSAGALLKVPVCREKNLSNAIHFMKQSGLMAIGAGEDAKKPLQEAELTHPVVLVLGAEGKGIGKEIAGLLEDSIKISMAGTIGSLNVSVAAGIIFHEAMHQRLKAE